MVFPSLFSSAAHVFQPAHWDRQYAARPIWDTGRPCPELQRVMRDHNLTPQHAMEFGCGAGNNAVWLARRGVQTSAIDLSSLAITHARRRAQRAGVSVDWRVGDLRSLSHALTGQFDFVLDRGCYHVVRKVDLPGYLATVLRILRPLGHLLLLTGNAYEPEDELGPPVLTGRQLVNELEEYLDLIELRSFRWDALRRDEPRYLGWSCFLRRRSAYPRRTS